MSEMQHRSGTAEIDERVPVSHGPAFYRRKRVYAPAVRIIMRAMSTTDATFRFFATCARGIENLLEDEIRASGADDVRQTVAGVHFRGPLAAAYQVGVFSRLANRLVLQLHEQPVSDADSLYDAAMVIDWPSHLSSTQTLSVRATGSTPQLTHTQFIARRVKDAVVDQFRDRGMERPDVSRSEPDLVIHAVLRKGQVSLGIDLVGSSLHRRHYRQEQGTAPLKETLAAAVLIRAGWPERMTQPDALLADPLCGAGTLLIEGLLMARDIAPGLLRQPAFSPWPGHDAEAMQQVLARAEQRREAGKVWSGSAFGSDTDRDTVQKARRNAERAGVYDDIEFVHRDLSEATAPRPPTLIVSNPPYAERLGEEPEVMRLYQHLGEYLQRQADGCQAAILTGRPEWGRLLGIHSHRQYRLFNGSLPVSLLCFDIRKDTRYQRTPGTAEALDEGAQMLANRLRKNLKSIGKWARKEGHECYRLYDADMPEYAFAIDLYGELVHMQEYRAPSSVDERAAAHRRQQALQAVMAVLDLAPEQISLKVREKQKGRSQYTATDDRRHGFTVSEGPARFHVNLHRYLDTGLFLDHRPVRRYLREHAKDRRFLNLFCYTGTATVHAALGDARSSVSVDLSHTYLDWARENFRLNGLEESRHELRRADCMDYLERAAKSEHRSFDLIFLDPPTFSNSKSADNVLDVQRDHGTLIDQCMSILAPGGELVFSTNRRRFVLDERMPEQYSVRDISRQSIDRDFARHPEIHRTYLISAG
ncbi:MAG: bifunctional 23S rRNA (guanine(2069)-N(7))-methyltransferase RlmK/23S rRNA (guanine(2445)-N(2))-methyltransferase RlmL [Pseudohongiellaceae bacterium]